MGTPDCFILGVRGKLKNEVKRFLKRHKKDLEKFIQDTPADYFWDEECEEIFTEKFIVEEINRNSTFLDDQKIKEYFGNPLTEEDRAECSKEYLEEMDGRAEVKLNFVYNLKEKGLNIYSLVINDKEIPSRVIAEFFINVLEGDVDEEGFRLFWDPDDY